MNNAPLEAPTIEDAEKALSAVTDEIMDYRLHREVPRGKLDTLDTIRWSSLMATDEKTLVLRSLMANPVNYGLRIAVRMIGQTIYDTAGMKHLEDAVGRVAASGVGGFGRRMSFLDSALNGVGKGRDIWVS